MMDDKERGAGLHVITRGTRLGMSVVLSMRLIKSLTTCDSVNTLYCMFERRNVLTAVVEILQKFVRSSNASLVGRTYTS